MHSDFWESPAHREFVEALSLDRQDALRDLLLVGALIDDLFTHEERVELAHALRSLPGLDGTLEFDTATAVDHVDDVYARYKAEGDSYLEELLARLGGALDLSHALEAVVVLMATNDNGQHEGLFARRLGVLMDVPDEFVDDLLHRFGWTD